jgi:transcriptional regulator with XRE-family HTH domain
MTESALSRYAGELKAWREKLGVTQPQFADQIGYSAALVAAIEQSRRSPTPAFAKACDGATGAPGTFERWQTQVTAESFPAFFAPVVEFEQNAVRIHGWELGAIPGLLQSEDYARGLISTGYPSGDGEYIDRLVRARMERQEILTRDTPPLVWYVVDEAVLRRAVGSTATMAAQLDKLIDISGMPGMVIQVLPFSAEHAATDGPISVYEFTDSPAVCYTECHSGGRIVEERTEVADMMMIVNLVRSAALSRSESQALLHQIRSELDE